jgi:hypothetical protein
MYSPSTGLRPSWPDPLSPHEKILPSSVSAITWFNPRGDLDNGGLVEKSAESGCGDKREGGGTDGVVLGAAPPVEFVV